MPADMLTSTRQRRFRSATAPVPYPAWRRGASENRADRLWRTLPAFPQQGGPEGPGRARFLSVGLREGMTISLEFRKLVRKGDAPPAAPILGYKARAGGYSGGSGVGDRGGLAGAGSYVPRGRRPQVQDRNQNLQEHRVRIDPEFGPANPYPSEISASGFKRGKTLDATPTLGDLGHGSPLDAESRQRARKRGNPAKTGDAQWTPHRKPQWTSHLRAAALQRGRTEAEHRSCPD